VSKLRKVLTFAEVTVKKMLTSLEKCKHLLRELLKVLASLCMIYIFIYKGGGGG